MHYTQALRGFRCFLFDLDGTLLDSMPLWDHVYLKTLAHFGISVPADYLMHVNHLSVRDGAVYTVQSLGLDTTPEEIIRIWASLGTAAYRDSIQLKPHAADLLRLLRADGKTLGIATALGKGFFESCLARNGVLSLFSDSTSVEEVGRGKDSPAIYLRACEKAGAAPGETVVFEDSLTGATSAKQAGFFVVGVYDASAEAQRADMIRTADLYITDYRDLLYD